MSKAKATVSWIGERAKSALQGIVSAERARDDYNWTLGDLIVVLFPTGKEDLAVKYVGADGKTKRFPTMRAAWESFARNNGLAISFAHAVNLRTTATLWPAKVRPAASEMCWSACRELNTRRTDTGPKGLAEMDEWIAHTIQESGTVTTGAAKKRAHDTDPSPIEDAPKGKGKPKGKPEPKAKPLTGADAWAEWTQRFDAVVGSMPKRAVPDDGTESHVVAGCNRIVGRMPNTIVPDVKPAKVEASTN